MYEWILVAHIFAVISWMAATFYLPRLFVYHSVAEVGSDKSETFKVMERRLMKGIMTPSMIATWGFGLWLMVLGEWHTEGWMHVKLLVVFILSAYHGMCVKWMKGFASDSNTKSQRFFRIVNEVPVVFLLIILVMVVVKPF